MLALGPMARAQFSNYISLGMNQSFLRMDSLDLVIDTYNNTRTYLDRQMSDLAHPGGFTIQYGVYTGRLLVEMGYTAQKRKTYAQGVDQSGQEVRRDLRLRQNAVEAGLGYRILAGEWGGVTPGIKGIAGTFSVSTRVAPVEEVKQEKYNSLVRAFNPGVMAYVQIMLGSIHSSNIKCMITPYYQWGLKKVDMEPVNAGINPATATGDRTPLPVQSTAFGIKLQLAFYASGH